MTTVTAHILVKNEARFVWFAVMSVIEHVDKILLWDTGSTDGTVDIIKEIIKVDKEKKVDFREVGEVNPVGFTKVRQEMLDRTDTDWFIVVDGDEVWWQDSIKNLAKTIRENGDKFESIISPNYNLIGDIYHYQPKETGNYKIDHYSGHINIRAVKNISGLQFKKPHGQLGIYDKNDVLIQDRDSKKRIFIDSPYLHFTNIQRSTHREKDLLVPKRANKLKYELGIPFPADFYYPEVFFKERPQFIPLPWEKRNKNYILRALIEFPSKYLKRKLVSKKVGY